MKAKSITGKNPSDVLKALEESRSDACQPDGQDFKPTLAIIILSNIEYAEQLRSIFRTQGIAIFGITAPQKITEHGITEVDIVVLLMDIKPDNFKIVLNDYQGSSAFEAGYKTGIAGKNAFANPCFIISPVDIKTSGDDLIRGLTEAAGHDIVIAGGVAGDPNDFSGNVFTNSVSSTGGILALIIDQDKVSISGLAISGWKPAGTSKKNTKSDGSWIFTIGNEPAMNVIQRYLGNEIIISNIQASESLPSELGYPLQFERASENAIMKPALFFNPTDQS